MKSKEWESDYKLIPMPEISEEAREVAKRWYDGVSEMNDIREKHKLASDIMNYSRRRAKDRDIAIADKEKERLYWQQRCEAAESIISCVPLPDNPGCRNLYLPGFNEAVEKYQQLKQQQP